MGGSVIGKSGVIGGERGSLGVWGFVAFKISGRRGGT